MTDFRSHIKKGLRAHEESRAAKAEIASVIEEVNRQASEATEGLLGIKIELLEIRKSAFGTLKIEDLFSPDTAPYLVAYNKPSDGKVYRKLASWAESETGYPCSIRYGGQKKDCHDKASLEIVLAELLASPSSGKLIWELVNYQAT